MSKNKWTLSPELSKQLTELSEQLNVEVEQLREDYDNTTEAWQDSDRGTDVGSWVEDLENLADTLTDLEAAA